MVILKTESQLKSFMHRKSSIITHEEPDFDNYGPHSNYNVFLNGKKVIASTTVYIDYGLHSHTTYEVIAIYNPRKI